MLRKRMVMLYYLECDECGCYSPDGYSNRHAREIALANKWVFAEIGNEREYTIRHLCPACAAELGLSCYL